MLRSLHIRNFFQSAKRAVSRAVDEVIATIRHYPRTMLVLLAIGVGVFCTLVPAYADSPGVCSNATDLICSYVILPAFNILASIAYAIGALIMSINLVLAWLLVSFAKYNVFVNATPVQIGWPLVRDVVNMFFIVVLLVVAFSTIIGYRALHYKDVLPKLLLMAVLINFSKTLVGVLIDFSQVITLTFVNGFAQAAFGNFAKAFQLSNILQVAQAGPSIGQSGSAAAAVGSQDILSVMMALLFGIAIMTVTATVLLIMCIYFLARIVLLWMLLIFSPMAFFVLALPAKLQKGVGQFAGEWWKQLGALLTGGPIVAFFLWLTLAVIQQSATPFPTLYQPASATEAKSLSATITKASDPSNITTMMVAILMLMLGLKTAVQVSKEAAPAIGNAAEKIRAGGGPVGMAARLSYRGARAGVTATGRAADRRFNLSGRASEALLARGQQMSQSGSRLGALAGASLTRAGGQLRGIGVADRAAVTKAFEDRTKHLSPAGKLQALDAEIARAKVSGNKRAADVLLVQKGLLMKDGPSIKARTADLEKELLDENKKNGLTDEESTIRAKSVAAARAKQQSAEAMAAAIKAAEDQGNLDVADKLKEAQSKDPSLHSDLDKLYKLAANKIDDHKQAFKEVKTEAWQDSGTFLAYMKASGLIDEKTGKMKEGYEDDEKWKELTSAAGGNRTKYVQAQVKNLETEDGAKRAVAQLAAMKDGADSKTKDAGNDARQTVSFGSYKELVRDDDGKVVKDAEGKEVKRDVAYTAYAETRKDGVAAIVQGERDVQNFNELIRGLPAALQTGMRSALEGAGMTGEQLNKFAQKSSRSFDADQAAHVRDNAAAYAGPAPVITGAVRDASPDVRERVAMLVQGQAKGVPAPEASQKFVIEAALDEMASGGVPDRIMGASAIANINVRDIKGDATTQQAIADKLDGKIDELAKLYSASKGNPSTQKNFEEVVRGVSKQAANAAAKAARGETLSDVDKKFAEIGDQIRKNKVLKQVAERGKSGKT
jgi:hypothetical protein